MPWWQTNDMRANSEAVASFVKTRVSAYASYLDSNEVVAQIVDVKDLPHPKDEILKAICMLLGSGTLAHDNQERLFQDGLLLANFQADIGDHPLFPYGLDDRHIDLAGLPAEDLSKINPDGNARFELSRPKVQADAKEIGERLRQALDLGRSKSS